MGSEVQNQILTNYSVFGYPKHTYEVSLMIYFTSLKPLENVSLKYPKNLKKNSIFFMMQNSRIKKYYCIEKIILILLRTAFSINNLIIKILFTLNVKKTGNLGLGVKYLLLEQCLQNSQFECILHSC